jgi:glycosidase
VRPHPTVYSLNTAVWLRELGTTLADVPQAELERIARLGFDAVWLIGVWERSPFARKVALGLMPDAPPDDVTGSPYAIRSYAVDARFGGDAGLQSLRERLRAQGLGLMLDFVPNHVACDHPWIEAHPERFVPGSPEDGTFFAHGKDPYFPAWPDVAQLDYRRPDVRQAMSDELLAVAGKCDGVRCDMAMLVLRDVFLRTWGGEFVGPEFWPEAIARVKRAYPEFVFLAEVYWEREWDLQQMGFDYTYDKRLYDRLRSGDASGVRDHLRASFDFQRKLARFVENHDEERVAEAFSPPERARAAATVALMLPGLRLMHHGQLEGRRLRMPIALGRRAAEAPDAGMERFYERLLGELLHDGTWRLIEPEPAWPGNESHRSFIAFAWSRGDEQQLIAVNLSDHQAQCYLPLGADRLYLDAPPYRRFLWSAAA